MVALDLLGRRTALRMLWELRSGPLTFRALQAACDSNSRLVQTRLAEFKAAGLVEHGDGGFRLTEQGEKLRKAIQPLSAWAEQWGRDSLEGIDAAGDAPG